jgi:hypothetical protein
MGLAPRPRYHFGPIHPDSDAHLETSAATSVTGTPGSGGLLWRSHAANAEDTGGDRLALSGGEGSGAAPAGSLAMSERGEKLPSQRVNMEPTASSRQADETLLLADLASHEANPAGGGEPAIERRRLTSAPYRASLERTPSRLSRKSRDPLSIRQSQGKDPSSVTVHIGRIDVTAVTSPPAPVLSTPLAQDKKQRRPSLDTYLQRRDRRRT